MSPLIIIVNAIVTWATTRERGRERGGEERRWEAAEGTEEAAASLPVVLLCASCAVAEFLTASSSLAPFSVGDKARGKDTAIEREREELGLSRTTRAD